MSHSYRHTPIHGVLSGSDKKDKRCARKALRRRCKQLISSTPLEQLEDLVLPFKRELSDVWNFRKDGKAYWAVIPEPGKGYCHWDCLLSLGLYFAYRLEVIRRKKFLSK